MQQGPCGEQSESQIPGAKGVDADAPEEVRAFFRGTAKK